MTSSSTKGTASSVLDVVLHVEDLVLEVLDLEVPIKDDVVHVENQTSSSVLGIEDLEDEDENLVLDNFEDVVLNVEDSRTSSSTSSSRRSTSRTASSRTSKTRSSTEDHALVIEDLVLGSIEDVGLDVEDRGRG
mgnify:CR=1 FL=1